MRLKNFLILGSATLCIFAFSLEKKWLQFKSLHGKSYSSNEEEAFRFQIFQDNLERIQEHNERFARKEVSYSLEINKFSDITENEFRDSLVISYNSYDTNLADDSDDADCSSDDIILPDTYDYREDGAVTSVKDGMRYEGYGWAFAVAGALEAQVFLAVRSVIPLSAQQLIDCVDVENANKTFWGGKLDFVYDYIVRHGVFTEDEYPYTDSKGECQDGQEEGITPTLLINFSSECGIKQSLVLAGPVTAVIDASRLSSYQSGIVDNSMCSNAAEDANHAVLIVGFGKEEDFGEYWIIKNSWGLDWGEDGYFRLARLRNNTCGIGTSPSYPIIFHNSDNSSFVESLYARKVYFD